VEKVYKGRYNKTMGTAEGFASTQYGLRRAVSLIGETQAGRRVADTYRDLGIYNDKMWEELGLADEKGIIGGRYGVAIAPDYSEWWKNDPEDILAMVKQLPNDDRVAVFRNNLGRKPLNELVDIAAEEGFHLRFPLNRDRADLIANEAFALMGKSSVLSELSQNGLIKLSDEQKAIIDALGVGRLSEEEVERNALMMAHGYVGE
jgi:hypothetical protein